MLFWAHAILCLTPFWAFNFLSQSCFVPSARFVFLPFWASAVSWSAVWYVHLGSGRNHPPSSPIGPEGNTTIFPPKGTGPDRDTTIFLSQVLVLTAKKLSALHSYWSRLQHNHHPSTCFGPDFNTTIFPPLILFLAATQPSSLLWHSYWPQHNHPPWQVCVWQKHNHLPSSCTGPDLQHNHPLSLGISHSCITIILPP